MKEALRILEDGEPRQGEKRMEKFDFECLFLEFPNGSGPVGTFKDLRVARNVRVQCRDIAEKSF